MEMDVFHSTLRFTRQTRRVEVIDVGDFSVEEVEGLEHDPSFAGQPIAKPAMNADNTVAIA